VAVVIAVGAITPAAGCGRSPVSAAPSPARVRAAFAGSPPPLAALHATANQLLGGGVSAFRRELAKLRGYPVVINKWGSWCGPCRFEFPYLQEAAVRFGRRVAFLGLDGEDNPGDARAFLRRFPVTYPSYQDPSQDLARSLHAPIGYPETVFLDRQGHMNFIHQGAYPNQAALLTDVSRYALGS
jgi:cytochrome c biogenesis protein CcmG/thiol:disulfide interchange protein DsbE